MAHFEIFEGAKKAEYLEQVDYHNDYNNSIQYTLNFAVHRDIGIHKPEQHSDNNQKTDDINERHDIVLLTIRTVGTPSGPKGSAPIGSRIRARSGLNHGQSEYRDTRREQPAIRNGRYSVTAAGVVFDFSRSLFCQTHSPEVVNSAQLECWGSGIL
jgi:hypothetical protein